MISLRAPAAAFFLKFGVCTLLPFSHSEGGHLILSRRFGTFIVWHVPADCFMCQTSRQAPRPCKRNEKIKKKAGHKPPTIHNGCHKVSRAAKVENASALNRMVQDATGHVTNSINTLPAAGVPKRNQLNSISFVTGLVR